MEFVAPGEPEQAFGPITESDLASISDVSQPYLIDWHILNSTTNWEKGRIILGWRQRLIDSGAAPRLYSDPAWSRLVGEVSAQHVGRLRRTYERFGEQYQDYAGLYWSHFYAALDWHDAEMWLEGGVQNKWSVSKMRYQRWEATGGATQDKPQATDIVVSVDEEGLSLLGSTPRANTPSPRPDPGTPSDELVRFDDRAIVEGPLLESPDFGDDPVAPDAQLDSKSRAEKVDVEAVLQAIPTDVAGPFREFRAAIEKHKRADWQQVKRLQVIALINDLKRILRKNPTA